MPSLVKHIAPFLCSHTPHRNTLGPCITQGPQNTLGNISYAGRTWSCNGSQLSGSTRMTQTHPSEPDSRALLTLTPHIIPNTRIPIRHGIPKHKTSPNGTNPNVGYENAKFNKLLPPSLDSTRWPAHSTTSFTNTAHSIKHI